MSPTMIYLNMYEYWEEDDIFQIVRLERYKRQMVIITQK